MSGAGAFLTGLAGGVSSGEQLKERRRDRELEAARVDAMKASVDAGLTRMERGVMGAQGGGSGATGGASVGGSQGGEPSFTYDGAISDRVGHAYKRLTSEGLPSHVAAGLVGNLMQESGAQIDPAAVGDNGNAFGAAQWNGPRRRAYHAYAKKQGVDPTDFDAQIDYLLHEGQTSEQSAWNKILQAETAEEAARVASDKFWRPGVPHKERRAEYARTVYDRFGNATTADPAAQQKKPKPAATAKAPNSKGVGFSRGVVANGGTAQEVLKRLGVEGAV